MEITDIVAISAVRTPMGRFGGTLKDMPVYHLGATAIKAALERAKVDPKEVGEVILGNCRQAGNGPNPARSASLFADVPAEVPVQTINMACPSGMKTLALGSQVLRLGEARYVVCGGMDSMSTIPYLLKGVRFDGFKMGDKVLMDGWSDSIDPVCNCGMGVTAENLVEKWKIGREEMDQFAFDSHQKAARAQEQGWFDAEITPVTVPAKKKQPEVKFDKDESIRAQTTVEKMARLPAVFKKGGSVTAANSCGMTDGACALVLTTRKQAKAIKADPLFSIMAYSNVAVDGLYMGEGPGVAIPEALKQADLTLDEMDLIEVNEAFAAQVLTNERMLKWDRSKLNVHGGAIALGHPTGISGARIVVTMYHALKGLDKELGVASICGGGGVSMAMIIKREN
jgi:acetyl-CoA C-acetyltransferase